MVIRIIRAHVNSKPSFCSVHRRLGLWQRGSTKPNKKCLYAYFIQSHTDGVQWLCAVACRPGYRTVCHILCTYIVCQM